jgi:hypothetical protein
VDIRVGLTGFDHSMVNACYLPPDHPVLLTGPSRKERKNSLSKCAWMRIECNAWRWRFGPTCGLTPMHELKECKWLELREKLLRRRR